PRPTRGRLPLLRVLDLVGVLPAVAVLVVLLALVRVGEDLEGGGHFLEARLGRPVVRGNVRVVLAGELTVGGPDLLVGGIALHAEGFVEVLRHSLPLYAARAGVTTT